MAQAISNTVPKNGLFSGLSVGTGGQVSYNPSTQPAPAAGILPANPSATQQQAYNSALAFNPVSTAPNTGLYTVPTSPSNVSGSSTINKQATAPVFSSSGGAIIPQAQPQIQTQPQVQSQPQQTYTAPVQQSQPDQVQSGSGMPQNTNTQTTQGLASGVINPQLNATIQALIKQAQSGSPQQAQAQADLTAAIQREQELQNQYANQTANIKSAGTDLSLQTGQEQNLSQQFAGREAAAQAAIQRQQAALGQAQTQQTQQLSAIQAAAGLQTPSNQVTQVSPGNYLANAQGNAVGGGQAQGLQNLTNLGIAQQNIKQGQQAQQNAFDISNVLQTIAPTVSKLTSFMQQNSLNGQDLPVLNQKINTINAQTNPVAYQTMQLAIGDIKSFTQQILQSTGGVTPTDAGNIVSSWADNMQNMTPKQLAAFTSNIEALGQIRLSQAQSALQTSYGANATVGAPAQGMDANTSAQLQSTATNILNDLPDWAKAGAGLLIENASAVGGAISGAGSALSPTAAAVLVP